MITIRAGSCWIDGNSPRKNKFKKSRLWLKKYEGQRIGFRRLVKVSNANWDEILLYYRRGINYKDLTNFLIDNIGKPYQEVFEDFLKKVKPILGERSKCSIFDAESIFRSIFFWTGDKRNGWICRERYFYIDDMGLIRTRKFSFIEKKAMSENKNKKKSIIGTNGYGTINVTEENIVGIKRLDKKLYIIDPDTLKLSPDPVKVCVIPERKWRGLGKDKLLMQFYTRVIVPYWKVEGGIFAIKKK